MSDEELDVFSNLNKFLNVTPNQYQREMEEFAHELSSESDADSTIPESPVTPSPVRSSIRSRQRNVTEPSNNIETETKIKKSKAQLRLEKIKADLALLASPGDAEVLPPKISKPSPPKTRTRARPKKPDTIDLTSCVPVTMGFVNLDSDGDEDCNKSYVPVQADFSFESENYEMSILVRWEGNCEKFTLRRHQKFEDLMKILAQRENVDIKNIYLDFEEKFLEPENTPHSIGYTAGKFICGRALALGRTKPQKEKKDPNLITIKIQSQSFKKPLSMKIMKNEEMKIVFIKLAEELKCQMNKIQLKFDGDKVLMDQTAEDIELEGGEILDLILE